MNLSRLRKLKYALPLAAIVMACTATASTAKPTRLGRESPIKIAILSDCKGAFAAFYGADVGGAIMAFVELTGAKVVNKNDPIKGMKGGAINGHPDQARRHRLLERHRRPRPQRDQAPDGEAEGRHHDRAAVG